MNFGTRQRAGLGKNYTLELDQDTFSVSNLLGIVNSFNDLVENSYTDTLDDSEILILPEPMINAFSDSGRKNYFDIATLLSPAWRVTQADRLPDLVTRSFPTVVGVSLAKKNTAIIYDRDIGALQLSLDDILQTLRFDMFGNSFQRSLSDAFDEISIRRPDVVEKIGSAKFLDELKRILTDAGAK